MYFIITISVFVPTAMITTMAGDSLPGTVPIPEILSHGLASARVGAPPVFQKILSRSDVVFDIRDPGGAFWLMHALAGRCSGRRRKRAFGFGFKSAIILGLARIFAAGVLWVGEGRSFWYTHAMFGLMWKIYGTCLINEQTVISGLWSDRVDKMSRLAPESQLGRYYAE